jgi:hypothetical protein
MQAVFARHNKKAGGFTLGKALGRYRLEVGHEQVGAIRQRIVSASLYPAMLMLVGAGSLLLRGGIPTLKAFHEGTNFQRLGVKEWPSCLYLSC